MSTPPNAATTRSKAVPNRCSACNVARDRESRAANRLGAIGRGIIVDVEQGNLRAGFGECVGRCTANSATGSGDHHNLTCERQWLALTELGEFERPVFDIERVGFGDRFKRADRFRSD